MSISFIPTELVKLEAGAGGLIAVAPSPGGGFGLLSEGAGLSGGVVLPWSGVLPKNRIAAVSASPHPMTPRAGTAQRQPERRCGRMEGGRTCVLEDDSVTVGSTSCSSRKEEGDGCVPWFRDELLSR